MTLEGEVLPWVSMAEALGWIDGPEPSLAPTVSGGGTGSGGGVEIFAGKASRERARRSVAFRNGNQDNAAVREESEPAPTVAFGHNAARVEWVMEKKEDRPERKAQGAGNTPRSLAEPAATIDTRADLNRWASDRPAPTIVTTRRSKDGILVGRQLPEGEGENVGGHNWPSERPSTAVCGDPRISPPGYRGGKAEYAELGEGETPERSGANAIRVTLPEALILQSFPPDYPVQGSKSKRFQQVGNAVPPLLAHAILSALLAPVLSEQKPQALERSAAA